MTTKVLCSTCVDGNEFEMLTVGFVFSPCEICGSTDETRRSYRMSDFSFETLRLDHLRKRFQFEPGSKWKNWISVDNWLTFLPEEIFERVPPHKAVELIRQHATVSYTDADRLYIYGVMWAAHLYKNNSVDNSRQLQLLMEITSCLCNDIRFIVLDDIFESFSRSRV